MLLLSNKNLKRFNQSCVLKLMLYGEHEAPSQLTLSRDLDEQLSHDNIVLPKLLRDCSIPRENIMESSRSLPEINISKLVSLTEKSKDERPEG